jgi:hypothetical protein
MNVSKSNNKNAEIRLGDIPKGGGAVLLPLPIPNVISDTFLRKTIEKSFYHTIENNKIIREKKVLE